MVLYSLPKVHYDDMTLCTIVPEEFANAANDPSYQLVHSPLLWLMDRVVKMKNRLKISHLGKYSSERANNLDKYCQQTSLIRVLLTCVLLPWPALLLVLVMECIPLHDPADGLKSNYGVVIRLFIVLFCAAAGSLFQIRATTPQLFYWKIAVISIGTGVCAVIILVVVANLWIFPLPFCLFMTGIPAAAFFVVLFLVLVQPQNSITSLLQENAMWQKIVLISTQTIIALVYVTFGICFSMSTSKQRIGLLVFQPFMKLGLKHLAAQQVNNNPECIPVVVVFTIDVFNGLYSSICMQSSSSWSTSFVMTALNVAHTALSTLEIHQATSHYCGQDHRNKSIVHPKHGWIAAHPAGGTSNRSFTILDRVKTKKSFPERKSMLFQAPNAGFAARKSKLLHEILFQLEYRVLVGYIEAVIPLMYASYLSILVCTPSAKYYPQSRSLSADQLQTTIRCILIYATSEILSLVWFHGIVKHKLGFSLLFNLAFVLETEVEQIQSRLFVWIILLLQLPLEHFGASQLKIRCLGELCLTLVDFHHVQAQILAFDSSG